MPADGRRGGDGVGELIGGRNGRDTRGVMTVTSTVPVPAGRVAVIEVSSTTTSPVAVVPKSTSVAPVKPAGDAAWLKDRWSG